MDINDIYRKCGKYFKGRGEIREDKERGIQGKRGKEIGGIPGPLNSPPSSPLPSWPMVHHSYKFHLYSLKIVRDKTNFIIFTRPKLPQNTFGHLNTSFNNEWISANLVMIYTSYKTFLFFEISIPMYVTRGGCYKLKAM